MPSNAKKNYQKKKKNHQKKKKDAARRYAQTSTDPVLDDSVQASGAGTSGERGDSPVKVAEFFDIGDNTQNPISQPKDGIRPDFPSEEPEIPPSCSLRSLEPVSQVTATPQQSELTEITPDVFSFNDKQSELTVNEEKRTTEFPLRERENKVSIQRKRRTSWMSCCGVFDILRNIFRS